ncbi:M14 family zinc carboxypeptidase [Fictibacillus nanhaiensis]|uniref:M14 family zinc carboxypeptidase n=1 Tax=Fictibacillus nanhaiensis TaxID=742169 RepID=UPI003C16A868
MKWKLVSLFAALLFASVLLVQPAKATSYVNPNQVYTYERLTLDIKMLAKKYPGLVEYQSLGKSPYGREIWAVKLGKGDATVFYNASHHAREWLTTNIVMEMLDQYSEAYSRNAKFEGYDVRKVLNGTSIWFVPMVNPDGVTLQQKGLNAFPKSVHKKLIKMNGGSKNFKRWKANGQGIDLNRQYPANWNNLSKNSSVKSPAYKNFSGTKPLQTLETQKLTKFTYFEDPEITVSYHSSGRILFWYFNNKAQYLERDRKIAQAYGSMSRYSLVKPSKSPAGGGYKDWFIQTFNRPGLTPEISYHVGETNPPLSVFNEEWKRNRKAGLYIANEGKKLWEQKVIDANFNITTFQRVPLYNRPNTQHKTSMYLSPAYVKVTGIYNDYFRVSTSNGPKWIKKGQYIQGTYKKINTQLWLTEKTQLHRAPIAATAGTFINSQVVQAVKSYGDWYAIQTPNGEKWIKPHNEIVNYQPKDISKVISLTTLNDWYEYPIETKKKEKRITPQDVTSSKQWGQWYLIQTTEGQGWIKLIEE